MPTYRGYTPGASGNTLDTIVKADSMSQAARLLGISGEEFIKNWNEQFRVMPEIVATADTGVFYYLPNRGWVSRQALQKDEPKKPSKPAKELLVFSGHSHWGTKQVPALVAASSKTAAAKLLGISLRYLNDYWGETGNARDIQLARSVPDTVLFNIPNRGWVTKEGTEVHLKRTWDVEYNGTTYQIVEESPGDCIVKYDGEAVPDDSLVAAIYMTAFLQLAK